MGKVNSSYHSYQRGKMWKFAALQNPRENDSVLGRNIPLVKRGGTR